MDTAEKKIHRKLHNKILVYLTSPVLSIHCFTFNYHYHFLNSHSNGLTSLWSTASSQYWPWEVALPSLSPIPLEHSCFSFFSFYVYFGKITTIQPGSPSRNPGFINDSTVEIIRNGVMKVLKFEKKLLLVWFIKIVDDVEKITDLVLLVGAVIGGSPRFLVFGGMYLHCPQTPGKTLADPKGWTSTPPCPSFHFFSIPGSFWNKWWK